MWPISVADNRRTSLLKPPVPLNETARLIGLHSLRILDTSREKRYDRITRIAQRTFGVEICLISLVDTNRQWFKSRQGLDACETDREISFCGHAILDEQTFVIPDASKDERFADNPLVSGEPNIRFYAGCPIHAPAGERIGTLCIIDSKPREFSEDDQSILQDLGCMVDDELRISAEATVDHLTHIANRRGFVTVANHILALCRRSNVSATLLAFDLDNFKQVNDQHGHAAGDAVLQQFSKLLIKCFRSADVVARLGGDEFAVLMTGAEASSDPALARLYSMSNDIGWSAGSAAFDPDRHESVDSLLADADAELYRHKAQRRVSQL